MMIKPFSATATLKNNDIIYTQASDNKEIVNNVPLEQISGCLAACAIKSLQYIAKDKNKIIHNINVTKCEGLYDAAIFLGKNTTDPNRFTEMNLEVVLSTSFSEKEFNEEVHPEIIRRCPVYQMLKMAGVKMNEKWTHTSKE